MANSTYIALLRGINVSGHHKVPMADLKSEMNKLGFENITTLLNTGNVIFESKEASAELLEEQISTHLEDVFAFPIPVMLRNSERYKALIEADPFKDIEVKKETRLYVTFFKTKPEKELDIPWSSEDKSFQIISNHGHCICSVLDLSIGQSTKSMDMLAKFYGKNITTRNWNTLKKIYDKI